MGHAAMGHATPINAVDERTVGAVRPAKAPKGRKKDTSAMGNMMQYNGVTGKGTRTPSYEPGYGMPGSLNSVAYMGGMGGMGGMPQPMSRLSLPSAKVRPDGVETDVAMVLEKLVTKVEGQEAATLRAQAASLKALQKEARKTKERQEKESRREEAISEKEVRITLERLLKEVEKDEALQPNEVGSVYLDYVPNSSGPQFAGLMMHLVHGDPCTEWFDDKAASFRRLPVLESELRQALKVLPRSSKPGPKRK